MTAKTVPFSQSLTVGWEIFKQNALFLIGLVVAVALMNGVLERADEYSHIESQYIRFVINVIAFLVNCLIELGVINIVLKFIDGKNPEFGDLFNRLDLALPFAVATVLYILMVVVGLVFFVIPGFYIAVRFGYYGYFIVDEGADPIEALKKSSAITQGVRMDLFLFGLMIAGLTLLGCLVLFVGLLVAVPVTNLAIAFVYRHLKGATTEQATTVTP